MGILIKKRIPQHRSKNAVIQLAKNPRNLKLKRAKTSQKHLAGELYHFCTFIFNHEKATTKRKMENKEIFQVAGRAIEAIIDGKATGKQTQIERAILKLQRQIAIIYPEMNLRKVKEEAKIQVIQQLAKLRQQWDKQTQF